MDPLQIVLIVVAVAAVWALVELALLARRGRDAVGNLDRAVSDINDTLAEAKPVIAKLDDTLEELQPAVQRVEPLLASANVAVDALSANLVEVEAVVRDVSSFTGTAVNAKHAARGVADSASDAVQRLLGKRRGRDAAPERAIGEGDASAASPAVDDAAKGAPADSPETPAASNQYFTYGDVAAEQEPEDAHE